MWGQGHAYFSFAHSKREVKVTHISTANMSLTVAHGSRITIVITLKIHESAFDCHIYIQFCHILKVKVKVKVNVKVSVKVKVKVMHISVANILKMVADSETLQVAIDIGSVIF